MKRKSILTTLLITLITLPCLSATPGSGVIDNSVAGLFPLEKSGRLVWNFNAGWRFHLGDITGAEAVNYDDKAWEVVSTPHSVQLMPAEASGCRNYQGIAWYRKHFTLPKETAGRDVILHFEAIMGKQTIYVNGREVMKHEGGYLPITLNLTALGCTAGNDIIVAVKADNSDDKTYPPGKKQMTLDFAYHGGIYRDVWLIAKSKVAITDAVEENKVAGGGIFVHYDNISDKRADVYVNTEVRNNDNRPRTITVEQALSAPAQSVGVSQQQTKVNLKPGETRTVTQHFTVKNPQLWSPETPCLYNLTTRIREGKQSLDGGITKIGIRSFEFVRTDDAQGRKPGFYLNGQRYHQLVGANRHQDFAYVGNALPNSQQWRDAKRLRDAGFTIIRTAHYPQDPSFMDACDELGLFIIVATPGWQYWNKDKGWDEKVHQNTRSIIRRDRNHPCVLMWEPILNETRYPKDFSLEALNITREEFPYPGRPVAAADLNSEGVKDNYDVLYDWAYNIGQQKLDTDKCIFTREWGEYVDDWYAHNAINRAARNWGERPMIVAALSLADTYGMMFRGQRQFIGGWKYAFEMFRSQRQAPGVTLPTTTVEGEPMVFIAHELTPFSDADVVVFSNCDSVRLTALNGAKVATLPVRHEAEGIPNVPVVFKDFWDFWAAREQSYTKRSWQNVSLVAEGIIGGKVVCQEKKMPSRRSTKIRLVADEMGKPLVADGSDFIVVVAEITDDNGNVRRMAREHITFSVEGEGTIIGDDSNQANPRAVEWGSAPVLVRSTHQAGEIRVIAHCTFEGTHAPIADTLVIHSRPYEGKMCYDERLLKEKAVRSNVSLQPSPTKVGMSEEERRKSLEEVERQQQDFGTKE